MLTPRYDILRLNAMDSSHDIGLHLDDLKLIGSVLRRDYGAQRVLLYGSLASGEATADSDIDLLISAQTSEPFYQRMATVRKMLPVISYGLAVSPLVLTCKDVVGGCP